MLWFARYFPVGQGRVRAALEADRLEPGLDRNACGNQGLYSCLTGAPAFVWCSRQSDADILVHWFLLFLSREAISSLSLTVPIGTESVAATGYGAFQSPSGFFLAVEGGEGDR